MSEVIFFDKCLSLGQRVRIMRVTHRLTQEELAAKASVPQERVSALERDLPVYPSAKNRILKVLGLTVESTNWEAHND